MISLYQELDGEEIISTQRAIIINTSYEFSISDNLMIAPYLLLYNQLNTEIDVGLFANLFQRVNASYLIRVNQLRSIFTAEAKIFKGFSIGAAYDTSPLNPDNNLDLFVRYFY